ncbi:MAG: glycosyltransferase family 9 protein [Acetobacter sp.]|nr:glycosyltransferase family 9 protein [Acetobacter sp.]
MRTGWKEHSLTLQSPKNILIIRLGALGDFVQSFGPFQAFRSAYPQAHITLLTTRSFVALACMSPWFDTVEEDIRPAWTDWRGLAKLRKRFRQYDLVFDLQTSRRTARYFWLAHWGGGLGKKEKKEKSLWSTHVRGASLCHVNPWRNHMHTYARQRDQLRYAGVTLNTLPEISWLRDAGLRDLKTRHFRTLLTEPYALLVPGASAHRPGKRWSVHGYAELARTLAAQGIRPVVIGAENEKNLAIEISSACSTALDLTGQTSLWELAGLASRAWGAIGNDTGPMHLAAVMGCRCLVLFSSESIPYLTIPIGRFPQQIRSLWVYNLSLLSVSKVIAALW